MKWSRDAREAIPSLHRVNTYSAVGPKHRKSEGQTWSREDTEPCGFKVVFTLLTIDLVDFTKLSNSAGRGSFRGRNPLASLRKVCSSLFVLTPAAPTFELFQWLAMLAMLLATLSLAGCRQQMADQPVGKPLQASDFFDDGMVSRPLPAGTVARGTVQNDDRLLSGRIDGEFVDGLPFAVTREILERGQERFNIFCSPCHDRVGTGQGMIVRRGFRRAHSFHQSRLRQQADGYFFHVITHGFGAMPSYAHQITPHDRWAIVAYIRALQLSRHAQVAELPAPDREKLQDTQ